MRIEKQDGLCRLTLAGDIDFSWLQDNLDDINTVCDGSTESIAVDASAVTFVGSPAVEVIRRFVKHCEAAGGTVHLSGASPMFLHLLEICGLDSKVRVASAPDLTSPANNR